MKIELPTVDWASMPHWIMIIFLSIFIVAFIIFLWLIIVKNRGGEFMGIKVSKGIPKEKKNVLNKLKGNWEMKARDIEILSLSLSCKYNYEADLLIENGKSGIKISGYLTHRDVITNDKVPNVSPQIRGEGCLIEGHGGISYEAFNLITDIDTGKEREREIGGVGVLYLKFDLLSCLYAKGYFIITNQSECGIGIGTVEMKRRI